MSHFRFRGGARVVSAALSSLVAGAPGFLEPPLHATRLMALAPPAQAT
jgi:hypothetical protein